MDGQPSYRDRFASLADVDNDLAASEDARSVRRTSAQKERQRPRRRPRPRSEDPYSGDPRAEQERNYRAIT